MATTIDHPAATLARTHAAARPTVLPGGWELERLVACGQFSAVYQARAEQSDPTASPGYAIKLLSDQWQNHPAVVKLLQREALVGQAISHPHLISVLAAHVSKPPYFVVMPWLDDRSLADCVASGNPLPVGLAIWYCRQAAEALDALHQRGWMHGDVKPANILVSALGHVTLIDLGFARPPSEPSTPLDRVLLGTPRYLAPECLLSQPRADIRSDLYSLGVTLFELLAGTLPDGNDPLEVQLALRQSAARRLRAVNPLVPRSVSELLEELLARDPCRRPQSAAELVERLIAVEIETLADRVAG
jgi:serine/threonine protein kinase